jgi:hypothetical protein
MALVFAFQFVDAVMERRHEGFLRGAEAFAGRWESLLFWVLQIWLWVLLLGFSVARTLGRRLGRETFRRMLIGR